VLDELILDTPKAKEMVATLKNLVGDTSVLIILPASNDFVEMSARNLAKAKTLNARYLNVRDLLSFERVILPLGAVEVIESYLGR